MKQIGILFLTLGVFLFFSQISFAASSYVLPYPSIMPGGIAYKMHLVLEKIQQIWYFGSFGQFTYNLKESDKYLVEAKTLFEYQQYLLGFNSLEKSDSYFAQTLPNLQKAQKEGKDIREKQMLLHEASLKHEEVLEKMEKETPADFYWSPEKNPASLLEIHQLIQQAIKERQQYL